MPEVLEGTVLCGGFESLNHRGVQFRWFRDLNHCGIYSASGNVLHLLASLSGLSGGYVVAKMIRFAQKLK